MSNQRPRISILSAVDDELLNAEGWFHALANQSIPAHDYEVLIVDACHKTNHAAEFDRYRQAHPSGARIYYHRIPVAGRAKSLNYALEAARGELIAFLGDDCQPPLDFAETHVRFHDAHPDTEIVAIGLALFPSELRTSFTDWLEKSGRLWGIPMRPDMTNIPDNFFYVANASVKRKFLDRVGRFDESFGGHAWDDFEYGRRLRQAGMKAQLLAESTVLHMHEIDLSARERALRAAGSAARIYYAQLRTPAWPDSFKSRFHWLRRTAAYVRMRLAPAHGAAIENWWGAKLDAAFVRGYRKSTGRLT